MRLRLPAVPLKFKGGRNFQREGVTWPIVPRVNHPDGDPSAILWWIVDGRDSNFSDTVPGDWQISVHPAA